MTFNDFNELSEGDNIVPEEMIYPYTSEDVLSIKEAFYKEFTKLGEARPVSQIELMRVLTSNPTYTQQQLLYGDDEREMLLANAFARKVIATIHTPHFIRADIQTYFDNNDPELSIEVIITYLNKAVKREVSIQEATLIRFIYLQTCTFKKEAGKKKGPKIFPTNAELASKANMLSSELKTFVHADDILAIKSEWFC